jgi:RNA recognition motif-containing protein
MISTLFIDPIPLSFTSADLAALVRPYGRIISAKVVYDSLGQSSRCGYVKMETAEAAAEAYKNLNRAVLDGEKLTVLQLDGMETHEDESTLTGPT